MTSAAPLSVKSAPLVAFWAVLYFVANNLHHPLALHNPFVSTFELSATPLIPPFILPYLSFFPFLFWALIQPHPAHYRALTQYHLIQLLAFSCYLFNPLPVLFPRDVPPSSLQPLYATLHLLDQPLNSCPSLHVAMTLWALSLLKYRRPPWSQKLLSAWASIIIISTLLTHQHHLIDLLGGLLCATLVSYIWPLFPLSTFKLKKTARAQVSIARVAFATTLLFWALATYAWHQDSPWYFLLLWFSLAPLTVFIAYAFHISRLMHKQKSGTVPLSTKIIHAPLKTLWRLSRLFCDLTPFSNPVLLTPQTGLRPIPFVSKEPTLDLTAEYSLSVKTPHYQALPLLDMVPPSPSDIQAAMIALEKLQLQKPPSSPIWINCAWGRGRSVAIAIAWLVYSHQVPTLQHAIELVHKKRPGAVLSRPVIQALHSWQRTAPPRTPL